MSLSVVNTEIAHGVESVPKPGRLVSERHGTLILTLVFLMSAGILSYHVTVPWIGHHDWNGAWYSLEAQNYLRYGYGVTRLGEVTNADVVKPGDFIYYTHHPSLLPILVSFSLAVFGWHEWAARLVPIIFSLGSLGLVYLLGVALGRRRLGLLAAFFFALLPMNAYFGRMVDHEAVTNFFALASVVSYLGWHRTSRAGLLALSLATLALGMASGWPAYYLAAILPLHHVLVAGRGRSSGKILWYPLIAMAMFAVFVGHVTILQGGHGIQDLMRIFTYRTSLSEGHLGNVHGPITVGSFLRLWIDRGVLLFTVPVLLLALLALWDLVARRQAEIFSDPLLPPLLLLFGLTHMAVFTQGTYVHDYYAFYCAAPLALLAAGGLLTLSEGGANVRVLAVILLLFANAAVPKILNLYQPEAPDFPAEGRMVKEHTHPGELILTNNSLLWEANARYYAERDVRSEPVLTIGDLERAIRERAPRPMAFVLLDHGPGAEELGPWLSARYSSQEVTLPLKRPRHYHIFEIELVVEDGLIGEKVHERFAVVHVPASLNISSTSVGNG